MRSIAAALAVFLLACSSARERQVGALMESPIVPASDALFGAVVYTNGRLAQSPQSDDDWRRLEQHATNLREAAATLKGLAPPDDGARWTEQSDALARASSDALTALQGRNLDGVLEAGSRIYDACTSCHAVYAVDDTSAR